MVAEPGLLLPQERIPEKICEQIADVHVPQVVKQIIEVPVPEMVEQLVEVSKTVSWDRIKQRTVEQIVDARVPHAVEELADVCMVFSQDRIQERTVEQTILATSLAETIVVVPVIHMQGTTQRGVNTHAQHVVNAVEVEKPKIIELTSRRRSIRRPSPSSFHRRSSWTRLMTCPLLYNDRCPRHRQCRKQWRFHCWSSPTKS